MIFVGHLNGNSLVVNGRRKNTQNREITDIDTYAEMFAAVGFRNGQIWNYPGRQPVDFIEGVSFEFPHVAVSENNIVIGGKDCKLYVHQIQDG